MESFSQTIQTIKHIAVVIPYKDTPSRLLEVLSDINQMLPPIQFPNTSIYLFDDGSHTPILQNSLHSNIHLYRSNNNRGYGAVQKQAFDFILNHSNAELVLLLHGDNQYHLEDLLHIALSLDTHDFGLLNRMTNSQINHNHPFFRRYSNHVLTNIVNFRMKTNYQDLHSGGRVYTSQILKKIPYHLFADDFFFDQQMLLSLIQQGASGLEYPIKPDYAIGSSSIPYIKASKYALQCLLAAITIK